MIPQYTKLKIYLKIIEAYHKGTNLEGLKENLVN